MKTEIATTSWEDVVFESRNKDYGAYAIRKSYDENVSKASLIMILFASFVFGCLQIASLMSVKIKMPNPMVDQWGFTNPPIVIPNPPVKPATAKVEQTVNRNILERVVTHEVEPIPIEPIEPTVPSNGAGTDNGLQSQDNALSNGNVPIPVVVDPPKTLDFAEVMPEYQGGMSALMKFLRKNLLYPSSARMMGIEGSVFVRFVVDSRGEVTDVEVIKGVQGALDKEAMRVIAMMNKWKPGLQHNIPVNVRMVLPIKFKLENE
jgi:periplasmic protein TonB